MERYDKPDRFVNAVTVQCTGRWGAFGSGKGHACVCHTIQQHNNENNKNAALNVTSMCS